MTPPSPLDQVREAIETLMASGRELVLLEPGEEPIRLDGDNWLIDARPGRLSFQAWDDTRNIVRRVTALANSQPGRLELATERFGKKTGSLLLMDRRASRNSTGNLRATRQAFREQFRRGLRRQFPGWRLADVTTEPDLENSLSPTCPRAMLRKGNSALAAIAALPDAADPANAVTFGLIWLDYLRGRERQLTVEGLVLFLPAGRERTACLRLRWMNPKAARFAVYLYSEDGYEDLADLADYGNLDTRLAPATRTSPAQPTRVETWVQHITRAVPAVECVSRNDGVTSLRIRGLEFARATGQELLFGLETRRVASAANLTEAETLAAELARMRNPHAANHLNPLYAKYPEGWLESAVRGAIPDLDATLLPSPVYGQVPAFSGGDRGVIDLLAVDRGGRLAVMELKATEDIHLPVQALDYWMRVRWHAARAEFSPAGYFPGLQLSVSPPRLLLIAPAFQFHPSNEVVLRYFSSDIQVEKIGLGMEWRKECKVMFRH